MAKLRDKTAFPLSSITTWRERPPTSPDLANRGLHNMVFDYSKQQKLVPDSLGSRAVFNENILSPEGSTRKLRTTNSGGRPKALNVSVGGSPDVRSRGINPGKQKTAPIRGK